MPLKLYIYSSHLNFRRCYRLTRHPHVPSSTLRWLVVAVPSRKFHCCEYTLRWLVVTVLSRKSHGCEYTLRWLVVAVPSRKFHCCEYIWRLGPESNRRTRLCRPLHDHSATQPG